MKVLQKFVIASILLVCVVIASALDRTQFIPIAASFSVCFLIYVILIRRIRSVSDIKFWIWVAIILRTSTIFFFPNLSDDIYRFIWDGQLLAQGINPLLHLPEYHVSEGVMGQDLFEQLNSQNYFTVYPPVCQFFFWLGAFALPSNWLTQSIFLKLMMLLAEIGSIAVIGRLLKKLRKPAYWVLIYALNPLVILEITGNLHYEGFMIFFFLLGYLALLNRRSALSGALFGLSVMSKLITALVGPFLIRRLSIKSFLLVVLGGTICTLILVLPFVSSSWIGNFGQSLNLYFQKFEFNASFYYLAKWIGFQIYGYNYIRVIGPMLSALFVVFLLWQVVREKNLSLESLPNRMVIILTAYLLCSTTVHPWYLTTIIALAALSHLRYPVIWSYMIFMTYMTYLTPDYLERMEVVWAEYIVLGIAMIFEFRRTPLADHHLTKTEK